MTRDTLNKSLNANAFTSSFLRRQEPKTLWIEVPAFAGTTGRVQYPGHGLIQRFPRIPATWYSVLGATLILLVVSCVGSNPQLPGPTVFGEAELRSAFADLPTSFKEEDLRQDYSPLAAETIAEVRRGSFYSDAVAFVREDPYQRILAQSGWISDSQRMRFDKGLSGQGLLATMELGFAFTKNEGDELLESGHLPPPYLGDSSAGVYLEFMREDVPHHVEIIEFRHDYLVTQVTSYTLHQRSPDFPAKEVARMLDLEINKVEGAIGYDIAD